MNNSPKVDVKRPNKRTDLEGKKFYLNVLNMAITG